ncbi:hypothetical protein DM02DRAFT_84494 [Periconia macrospinosa]|uniref:AB hydrolase-1 domain-containing protein n=1 Tax=Periconia macrospinosa TaxID=97972 RepID=A0A2V1E4W4_9PLEO|nr:hypothetical protein DM02DRAFT_84494 [Periconia macrospinosa]
MDCDNPANTATLAEPRHKLLGASNNTTPLIICFHGSGESCEPSWSKLAALLGVASRVLLFERGPLNPKPEQATVQLLDFLKSQNLPGPYVLIAHSYGGAFARMFMHHALKSVAGAVLVETGQEGGLDAKIAGSQIAKCVLKEKPLSVIRGNSFIAKMKSLENSEKAAETEQQKNALEMQRTLLDASDKEDERMKKDQLRLSKNARYVHIPDCGHHVVRDRPDVVAHEVAWVLGSVSATKQSSAWRRLAAKLDGVLN